MTSDRKNRRLYDLFLEKEHSRRTFLKGVGAAAAAGTVGAACGPVIDPPMGTDSGTNPGTDSGPPVAQGLVGGGFGTGVSGTIGFTQSALDGALTHSLGGLDFVQPGDEVFVKVNMNSGNPFPYTSSPLTIAALTSSLLARGAGRVIFGDRSFFGANTAANAISTGIQAAATGAGAEWMVLDENNPAQTWIQIPQTLAPDWAPSGGFRIPGIFSTVDHIIHLAMVKTHFIAHYTFTVKLGFGSVHAADRMATLGGGHSSPTGTLGRQIAQVGASYAPSLHLLDAQEPVITGGPDDGNTFPDFGAIFASTDPVAIDATGLGVLKMTGSPEPNIVNYGVWNQPQLVQCIASGLGITGPAGYSLEGSGDLVRINSVRDWVINS